MSLPFPFASAAVKGAEGHAIPRQLNKQLIALEELISDADATGPDQDRTFHFIDLDDDGREDAVVFSSVGAKGGVGYGQYLSVFLQTGGVDDADGPYWRLVDYAKVGGKAVRLLDFDYLGVDGRVALNGDRAAIRFELRTREYQAGDPACCPSGKGTAVFEIRNEGRLVEVQPGPGERSKAEDTGGKRARKRVAAGPVSK